MKYIYRFRPGYGSKKYLIEIINAEQFDDNAYKIFFDAIKELSPLIKGLNKILLIMTDDFELQFATNVGNFIFYQDFWGFIFIESFDEDADINKIEKILKNDFRFIKEKVDINKYK